LRIFTTVVRIRRAVYQFQHRAEIPVSDASGSCAWLNPSTTALGQQEVNNLLFYLSLQKSTHFEAKYINFQSESHSAKLGVFRNPDARVLEVVNRDNLVASGKLKNASASNGELKSERDVLDLA